MLLDRRPALVDRRPALVVALLGLSLAVAGCGGSDSDSAQRRSASQTATTAMASLSASQSSPTGNPASSSPANSHASSSPANSHASSSPVSSAPAGSSPPVAGATTPRPTASAIPIGASLCSGADIAQNTADAYMGALSANDARQASACVLPDTVPAELTRSLLASASTTAVYLPRDGVDGPSVFGYRGGGKMIDVTVSKQPDGRFWVTEVAVRSG